MNDTTLVILAAGLGSRFGGNKQISHVGPHGEILMEYSVYDALQAGFTQVVFILKKDMVELIRSDIGKRLEGKIRVDYAVQDDTTLPAWYHRPENRVKPFGTTHAVLCAKDVIRGNFATVNADDYYGKQAFYQMKELLTGLKQPGDAAMVPYILKNTMSENGGVTRGVCRIKDGLLQSIDETKNIHYGENREILSDAGTLSGDSAVSMNLWGFHRDSLPRMQTYFEYFLRSISPEEIKAECLLPVMVGDFLEEGSFTVRAEASPDKWFGITYQEDRELVMNALQKLHDAGAYPEKLF